MSEGRRSKNNFSFAKLASGGNVPAMSVEQIEQTLLNLPREDRRRFAQWFYDHEGDMFDPQEQDEISVAAKSEILRRRDELVANPGLAVPVTDEWFDELKRKLTDVRAPQTPAA